jgi:hypothetical protein
MQLPDSPAFTDPPSSTSQTMTQIIIGYFGDQGGVTPPSANPLVEEFTVHNDTSRRIDYYTRFTLPLNQGDVVEGDRLWCNNGHYIQWEPLSTEEGTPRLWPDGSPRFIRCWTRAIVNSGQSVVLRAEKNNDIAPPAFVLHPNLVQAFGNVLTRTPGQTYSGDFNINLTTNNIGFTLKGAVREVIHGPMMSVLRVKQRDPNNPKVFHEWWIKLYSNSPFIEVILWTNASNTSTLTATFDINSHNLRVVNGEASWKGHNELWDAQSGFDYTGTNYRPYVNNITLADGQPVLRCRGHIFFYGAQALTAQETDTLLGLRQEQTREGCFRAMGRGWRAKNAWGPPGFVVDRPVWMASDTEAYNHAVTEARTYSPRGENNSHLAVHHLARPRLTTNYNPAATGWAPGFGILQFQAAVYTSCPLYLYAMEAATDFDAGRPVFIRDDDGSFMRRENYPSMAIWAGKPFAFENMETGGGGIGLNRPSLGIQTSVSRTQGSNLAITMHGYDEQHWTLVLPHHFLLSGDELAGRQIDHYRQSFRMHLNYPGFHTSVPGRTITSVFSQPYQPRGEGRSLGSCAWIEFVSPDQDFRDDINRHVKEMLNAFTAGGGLFTKGVHGTTYGANFLAAENDNCDFVSWSIFGPTGLQLDVNQMLSWEDGMAAKALQWMAVADDAAAVSTLERLFTTIAFKQVDKWWFLQSTPTNGTEDLGWHLIQAIPFDSNELLSPPAHQLPPARPWWGPSAAPPNRNTGYEDTGVNRHAVACPYPGCSGYPDSRFKIARDGLHIWNLNIVFYAYQRALALGNQPAILAKARDILNVFKNSHNFGPGGVGWWREDSPSVGIWLYNPDMVGDPLTNEL